MTQKPIVSEGDIVEVRATRGSARLLVTDVFASRFYYDTTESDSNLCYGTEYDKGWMRTALLYEDNFIVIKTETATP